MQQIINAILKNRNFFIYFLLLIFSLLFLQKKSPYHQSTIRNISLTLSGNLLDFRNSYQSYFQLREVNKQLMRQNQQLQSLLIQGSQTAPNDSTSGPTKPDIELISARIVQNSIDGVRNFMIVDKGVENNVTTEMGVISDDGIVGVIDQTNQRYASVVSLLHRDLKINAKLKKNNAFGSLYWMGIQPNKMVLSDIPTINPISIGDTVVTGGMSAYFPKELPIGKVSKYTILPSKRYYEIEVILFTNFSALDHVYIVRNFDKPLLDQLKK